MPDDDVERFGQFVRLSPLKGLANGSGEPPGDVIGPFQQPRRRVIDAPRDRATELSQVCGKENAIAEQSLCSRGGDREVGADATPEEDSRLGLRAGLD